MKIIENEKDLAVWVLVKVPRIKNEGNGADVTEKMLRQSIRENHFGGEKAVVRKLTQAERLAVSA